MNDPKQGPHQTAEVLLVTLSPRRAIMVGRIVLETIKIPQLLRLVEIPCQLKYLTNFKIPLKQSLIIARTLESILKN